MVVYPQFGCVTSSRAASLLWILFLGASGTWSQTDLQQSNSACTCPDGRQFSIGASLFGKSSARVVITGFRQDLVQTGGHDGLPGCKDLMVVGQTVRVQELEEHPFLRREDRKRGTIADICQTKIQFAEPKKSYDFFKDDGSAVTLGDMASPPNPGPSADSGVDGESRNRRMEDLTGRDLISMIPEHHQTDDPASSSFDVDDLKEGAYFIVRRQVKATPAADDASGGGALPKAQREVTVWAGSLGRIEKRAGFRDGPLWVVDILPHSAPAPFSSYLRQLPATFRKRRPVPKKFVLSSADIVEINHFLDQYSLEWTRFGDDSDDARKREFAGTTVLPDIYNPPDASLDENLDNAANAGVENDIREAARRLIFTLRDPNAEGAVGTLVLDDEDPHASAAPHLFHKQCFVPKDQLPRTAGPPVFRVADADLAIFQPRDSPQVPKDYYAVDVRLQLKSESGGSMPVVCRFPAAPIEETLLDNAKRILSRSFTITPAMR